MGGDAAMYYRGDYKLTSAGVEIRVDVKRHSDMGDPIFGPAIGDVFEITGLGTFADSTRRYIDFQGTVSGANFRFLAIIRWLAELP
jgi:hypothetical protein